MRRRTTLLLLAAACVALATFGAASRPSSVRAAATRTVTIEPAGPLEPGNTATVSWKGFSPGPAYIYVCSALPSSPIPLQQECYGDTLIIGETNDKGSGTAQFQVRSALAPQTFRDEQNNPQFVGTSKQTDCRADRCSVVVSECSANIATDVSAASQYDVTPATAPYSDDPHVDLVWGPYDESLGDFADKTWVRKPVEPEPEQERPAPVIAAGPTVRASGSDLGARVYDTWGRSAAETIDINFDFTNLDYQRGLNGVISGSFDMAIAGARPDAEQVQRLTDDEQLLVYVPISVSTVGVAYNGYPMLPLVDLPMDARAVAGLFDAGEGRPQPAVTLYDGPIGDLLGACQPHRAFNRAPIPYFVGGASDAHLITTEWLTEAVPALWPTGPTAVIPPNQHLPQVFLNNELVVGGVMTPKDGEYTTLRQYTRMGLVDTTWALRSAAPMASLVNESNKRVAPSAEGALATLATSTIGPDNVVDVDYRSVDPNAYPLVSVMYAVAPYKLTDDFTAERAEAVRELLTYFVSANGQAEAVAQGYVPMPYALLQAAQKAIPLIGSTQDAPATSTTTSSTSTTSTSVAGSSGSSSSTSTTATTRPSSGGGSSSGGGVSGSSGSTGGSRSSSGIAGVSPSATVIGSVNDAGISSEFDEVVDGPTVASSPAVDQSGAEDVFDAMLPDLPLSPGLPVLGAAGTSVLLIGQGINLWRWRLRRPRLGP